ncbi:GntR family transcriptional regulator [Microbacterium sp. STN6]|uniref:GntR family transcriptional regulator n=1 Tax=Microbacterium sp. STN6 TaxID=2995588 RepID=UPI0022609211|nr:GntR family transcriptional regulator [Microbacterium sp. STN6]MCX7522982.1 GntR family transcriptional regulator [Microbacterium sp. STN6]
MSSGGSPAAANAYRELLARLGAGEFKPGSRLPGERALAASLGISRVTLRQSLNDLAAEGWVVPSYKRGWYVRQNVVGEPPNTLLSFSEMAAARGLAVTSHMLSFGTRPVQFDEANSLQLPTNANVVEFTRVRFLDGVPVCHDRTVIAVTRAPGIEHADLENRSLYEYLRQECGVEILRSSYSVHAALMGVQLAALLQSEPSDPTLIAEELTFDTSGAPILRATLSYRADAYRFQANLVRQP